MYQSKRGDRPVDIDVRCGACQKFLAELLARPWRIRCPRCSHMNVEPGQRTKPIPQDDAPAIEVTIEASAVVPDAVTPTLPMRLVQPTSAVVDLPSLRGKQRKARRRR